MLTALLILAVLDLVVFTWSLENATGGTSTFWFAVLSVILMVAVWTYAPGITFAMATDWLLANTAPILVGAGCYVLAGVGYSFVKWYFRMRDIREYFAERYTEQLKFMSADDAHDHIAKRVEDNFYVKVRWDVATQRYVVDGSIRHLVIPWMSFWPLFGAYQACDYLFYRAWERIYQTLASFYKNIADRVLNG